ncbi:MAG TPA: dienelactone hydrolase family protein [Candidatus Baltobacteraceae bacterium]|nr:dienelactone hydrolase family protein [Candidatus Baltobacteraceae bacterium]
MQQTEIGRAEFVSLGGDLRGYYACPVGMGPSPGVVLFQEAFGINGYIESEVRRLASHGFAAIAPDLFRGETFGYGEWEKVQPKLQSLTDEGMLDDVRASIAFLDGQSEVKRGAVGCVGFCMGGRLAYLSATTLGEKIAAAASFYGGGIAPDQPRFFKPILDKADGLRGELLLIYGADDEGITPSEHGRIASRLSELKKRYTLSVYPGAPHGFASRDRESYRARQAEAAWAETLALFERALRVG